MNERKVDAVIRDIIIAALIGVAVTYLPFWIWDGRIEQMMAAMVLGVIAFIALVATEDKTYRIRSKAKN